jgi:outer membrane protein
LTAMNLDLQRMQREFREDLNLRKNEELAVVLEQANKAIQEIAETEKFDLILQEAVYRNPKIDITDMVIKHLADSKVDSSNPKTDSKTVK